MEVAIVASEAALTSLLGVSFLCIASVSLQIELSSAR